MALIHSVLVILATSLIATPQSGYCLPPQQGSLITKYSTITPPLIPSTEAAEQDSTDPPSVNETVVETISPESLPVTSSLTTIQPNTSPEQTTATPPAETTTTAAAATTIITTPPTNTPAITNSSTVVPTTGSSTIQPTSITTTPPPPSPTTTSANQTDLPVTSTISPTSPSISTSPSTVTESPSSTVITTPPPPPKTPHPGASVAISLFILLAVILMIGASVWWIRRRWQLERLRHQLMPVYNFDPTDDVDDWENQLLEEERSLRPEADKVQLYSGNATFEASQKPSSNASQKE